MSRKRYTPEQIIGKLREAEVALSQGQTATLATILSSRVRAEIFRYREIENLSTLLRYRLYSESTNLSRLHLT